MFHNSQLRLINILRKVWSTLYNAAANQHYTKYPKQTLKMNFIKLVMLVTLMYGFHINEKKKYLQKTVSMYNLLLNITKIFCLKTNCDKWRKLDIATWLQKISQI